MYYSPFRRFTPVPKNRFSLDLHVLSTPPTFVLSHDQTLQSNFHLFEEGSIVRLLIKTQFHYDGSQCLDPIP